MENRVVVCFANTYSPNVIMNKKEYADFRYFISGINQVRYLSFNKIVRWIRSNIPTANSYAFLKWYSDMEYPYWIYLKDKLIINGEITDDSPDYLTVIISGIVKPTMSIDISKAPWDYCIRYSANDVVSTESSTVNIKNVIFNNPATIVFWTDGTKTVCVCSKEDTYDPEKGLALCIMKKTLYNNKGHIFNNAREEWLKKAKKMEK